jgi:hypothetical protein
MRVLFTVALLLLQLAAVFSDGPAIPRPDHTEHARLARWIAHYNTWGTLSTQGQQSAVACLPGCIMVLLIIQALARITT